MTGSSVYQLDTTQLSRGWKTLPKLREKRKTHASAVLDGWLYVIGGTNGNTHIASTEAMQLATTNGWERRKPLPKALSNAAATAYKVPPCAYTGESIHGPGICGLGDRGTCLLCPLSPCSSLYLYLFCHAPRFSPHIVWTPDCSVYSQGRLAIYYPRSFANESVFVGNKNSSGSQNTALCFKGSIYHCGGTDGLSVTATKACFIYSPDAKAWINGPSMNVS